MITYFNNKKSRLLLLLLSLLSSNLIIGCNPNNKTEIGFECIDENINKYDTNSIFKIDNGLKVYAKYSNGSKEELKNNTYTFKLNSNSKEINDSKPFTYSGTYTCEVSYKQFEKFSYSFEVKKVDKILSSVSIYNSASKTSFEVGEKFSSYGLKLIVRYTDGSSEIISSGFTTNFDGYEFLEIDEGKKLVTVSYKGSNVSYEISVVKPSKVLLKIEINTPASILIFDVGDKFSSNGLILKLIYEDSSSETISSNYSTNYDNHEFTSDDVGTQIVNVSYKKCNVSYNITVNKKIIVATDISVSPSNYECIASSEKQLNINYTPYNANTGKEVKWESSNTNIATVSSSGLVKIKDDVTLGSSVDITATLLSNEKTSKCNIKIVNYPVNSYTLMIYMSANDLESKNGLASDDLDEMLAANSQPENTNVIIQTGGCKEWKRHNISNDKIGRYHIRNKSLILDEELPQSNMGESKTLQSFLEYGLTNYPAERTSLIFWNHGHGMQGVCFDQNYDEDSLLENEILNAVTNAFNNVGHNKKFDFIGYDACVMQIQDIASINASFADYMICSQENEGAGGLFYTTWLNRLFLSPNISTIDLLSSVCESYASHCYSDDYTISVIDLNEMDNYISVFDSFALFISKIIDNSPTSNWSDLIMAINKSLKFGYSTKKPYRYPYDVFDLVSFLNNLVQFTPFKECNISQVIEAYKKIIIKNIYGPYYQGVKPCGISIFVPNSGYTPLEGYTDNDTRFTNWKTMCRKYGDWLQ